MYDTIQTSAAILNVVISGILCWRKQIAACSNECCDFTCGYYFVLDLPSMDLFEEKKKQLQLTKQTKLKLVLGNFLLLLVL
jgi:hypothetical protein